ncbi:MAG: radical SAM protein [Candidatus Omnitrophota bacterium]
MIENLDELPLAAWDLLPMDKYRAHNWHCFADLNQRQPYAVIYTSLGCPFNCGYCPIHAFYGSPGIRFRSPEKVVEEIAFLVKNFGVKNIKILDELFTLKEERVSRICDLIINGGYNLNIWAYARIDTVNEAMLKKMKQAGINWLAFGIESANDLVRRDINKRIGQDRIKEVVAMAHGLDINLMGNFIFGLPCDDLKTLRQTLDFAKELNFEYINFYTAIAYPGSQLYINALQEGIKLPESWDGYSQYSQEILPLPTKYLSGLDVLHFRDNAFIEYFSNPAYLEMIKRKFGWPVVEHIKQMLENKIQRRC